MNSLTGNGGSAEVFFKRPGDLRELRPVLPPDARAVIIWNGNREKKELQNRNCKKEKAERKTQNRNGELRTHPMQTKNRIGTQHHLGNP